MEEIKAYKCSICWCTYDKWIDALECEFKHARYNFANALWDKGYELQSIQFHCGFGWKLTEEQKRITKDSCFIIPHWQRCYKPAYQIRKIKEDGKVYVSGKGSRSGYYGKILNLDDYHLKKPYSKEELFVYCE